MKIKNTLLSIVAVAMISTQAHAAIEINEQDFGPNYGTVATDIALVKPFQTVKALAGTLIHVAGLPFTMASGSVESSADVLVRQPWQDLKRCVGCTGTYDNYIKNQDANVSQTRFTVDGPAEIIINSDQKVVVNPY